MITQDLVSLLMPEQSFPPNNGPSHSRALHCVPSAQETEQADQSDQSFHTPSTEHIHIIKGKGKDMRITLFFISIDNKF